MKKYLYLALVLVFAVASLCPVPARAEREGAGSLVIGCDSASPIVTERNYAGSLITEREIHADASALRVVTLTAGKTKNLAIDKGRSVKLKLKGVAGSGKTT